MCNDTVRTRIEGEGMRAHPRGGLGMGNVESFRWRGGWKAKKGKKKRCVDGGDGEKGAEMGCGLRFQHE